MPLSACKKPPMELTETKNLERSKTEENLKRKVNKQNPQATQPWHQRGGDLAPIEQEQGVRTDMAKLTAKMKKTPTHKKLKTGKLGAT